MKLWNFLTAKNPAATAPISIKALVHACFTAFFGWSFLYFLIGAAFTDPVHNPYGHPAMLIACSVTSLLLPVAAFLWFAAFLRDRRYVRNFLVLLAAVVLSYYPVIRLWNVLYQDLGFIIRAFLDSRGR